MNQADHGGIDPREFLVPGLVDPRPTGVGDGGRAAVDRAVAGTIVPIQQRQRGGQNAQGHIVEPDGVTDHPQIHQLPVQVVVADGPHMCALDNTQEHRLRRRFGRIGHGLLQHDPITIDTNLTAPIHPQQLGTGPALFQRSLVRTHRLGAVERRTRQQRNTIQFEYRHAFETICSACDGPGRTAVGHSSGCDGPGGGNRRNPARPRRHCHRTQQWLRPARRGKSPAYLCTRRM